MKADEVRAVQVAIVELVWAEKVLGLLVNARALGFDDIVRDVLNSVEERAAKLGVRAKTASVNLDLVTERLECLDGLQERNNKLQAEIDQLKIKPVDPFNAFEKCIVSGSMIPNAMMHVYDWQLFKAWLAEANPDALREVMALVMGREVRNGEMLHVFLNDYARGLCGEALAADTIAWLRKHVADAFYLYVWW